MEKDELNDKDFENIGAGKNPSSDANEKQKEFLKDLKNRLEKNKDELTDKELEEIKAGRPR